MKPDKSLDQRLSKLNGIRLSKQEAKQLASSLKGIPAWLTDLLSAYPIIGVPFTLSEKKDRSGLGVEMQWFTVEQMVEEATEIYPGIPALAMGYVPIGMCLSGSGDPYFISLREGEDPPVVRIPHDSVIDDAHVNKNQIEIVATTLAEFLKHAEVD